MLIALLLAGAAPQTAVEAERAFAAAAREKGQWTAFRAFAADDATMFDPQPVEAQHFLAVLKDPAKAIEWAPAQSYVSCDGAMAANTGPWRGGAGNGFFSTIWVRQPGGGWKWIVDGGDTLVTARPWPAEAKVRKASCAGTPEPMLAERAGPGEVARSDRSADGTLVYSWRVGSAGARRFTVSLWNGAHFDTVIDDQIAAPRLSPKS